MGEEIAEREAVGYLRDRIAGFRGLASSYKLTTNSPESFERSDLNPALLLNRIS